MSDLIRHAFHGNTVRIVTDEHGEPWFVLADLLDALGITRRPAAVVGRLDPDGVRQAYVTDSLGRQQETHLVSERTGELVLDAPTPRVTPKGLAWLMRTMTPGASLTVVAS